MFAVNEFTSINLTTARISVRIEYFAALQTLTISEPKIEIVGATGAKGACTGINVQYIARTTANARDSTIII